jgi:2-keto-3-deoxy-L-rhamnonate aldolase RhmA
VTDLRDALAARDLLVGVEITSGSPGAVELVGGLAFDVAVLDTRHAPVSAYGAELTGLVRAAELAGLPTLARVVANTPGTINRAMNDGAPGIVVACDDAESARRASASMRYPPAGFRGAAPVVRAARFGLTPWEDYVRETNTTKPLVVSVERDDQIAAVPQLAATDGVDALLLDVVALGVSLGTHVRTPDDDPSVRDALRATLDAGCAVAVSVAEPDDAEAWRDAGCSLLVVGSDTAAYVAAARALRESLAAVPRSLAEARG